MAVEQATAQEVFDGVMLSDGCLKMRVGDAFFSMSLSGTTHIDWLYAVKNALVSLGAPFGPAWPRFFKSVSKGKIYYGAWLESLSCPELTVQYKRWYPKGVKCVPSDVALTPCLVGHWFMGDGSSSFRNMVGYTKNRYIQASFATCKFSDEETESLARNLRRIGIVGALKSKSTKGYNSVAVRVIDDVRALMKMVSPYVCESYRYKIKNANPLNTDGSGRVRQAVFQQD